MRRVSAAVAIASLFSMVLGGSGCTDSVGVPGPGPVTVSLVTPNPDDRAILVTVTGPGIEDVARASSGYTVHWKLLSDHEVRVIVFGTLSDGPIFTFSAPDRKSLAGYSGNVIEVADRYNNLRETMGEYAVTISASESH